MKIKSAALQPDYLAALRNHLKKCPASSLDAARVLGSRAVTHGLKVLDLAKTHEAALIKLKAPALTAGGERDMIRHAGIFFAGSLAPIEKSQRAARESNTGLQKTTAALTRRTEELAATNKELKHETGRRAAAEKSLTTSETTSSQLLEKSRRMQTELRQLSRRLLCAQEDERKRVSRELHDVIAQTLTGINLRLAGFQLQTSANAKDFHRKIAVTQRLLEKSVNIVHRFVRDLRPVVLDDLGLIPALEAYVNDFAGRMGIRAEFGAFAGVEKLDGAVKTVLYRVAQEALSNVARHAKASVVKVSIRQHRGSVRMEISDDGKGFVVEGSPLAKRTKRLGLLGMQERVEMAGGAFLVASAPGSGTTVRVDVPQTSAAAAKM